MAKTANVTARIQPEIKARAEAVLDRLGIPVSVLIDSLYRQIILTQSIPYSFALPTADTMTDTQFDDMLATGLKQAKACRGQDLDDAFAQIRDHI